MPSDFPNNSIPLSGPDILARRNANTYERYTSQDISLRYLASEFHLSKSRIYQIIQQEEQKRERRRKRK